MYTKQLSKFIKLTDDQSCIYFFSSLHKVLKTLHTTARDYITDVTHFPGSGWLFRSRFTPLALPRAVAAAPGGPPAAADGGGCCGNGGSGGWLPPDAGVVEATAPVAAVVVVATPGGGGMGPAAV